MHIIFSTKNPQLFLSFLNKIESSDKYFNTLHDKLYINIEIIINLVNIMHFYIIIVIIININIIKNLIVIICIIIMTKN